MKKVTKMCLLISKYRLDYSSIVDLCSEYSYGMSSWFGTEWEDIKKKVYEIIDMKPKSFEGEVKEVINYVEQESNLYITVYMLFLLLVYLSILSIIRCVRRTIIKMRETIFIN